MRRLLREPTGLEMLAVIDQVLPKPNGDDWSNAKQMIKAAIGKSEYDAFRFDVLFAKMREDGWSARRLGAAVEYFALNKSKYKDWSFSDFWEYSIGKFHDYDWMMREKDTSGRIDQLECYLVAGVQLWCDKLPSPLPFTRIWPRVSAATTSKESAQVDNGVENTKQRVRVKEILVDLRERLKL